MSMLSPVTPCYQDTGGNPRAVTPAYALPVVSEPSAGVTYVATFTGVAVTVAQDVFEIVAPANKTLKIYGIFLGQYSDFGDAQAELLSVTIMRGHSTSGSGGSTVTPVNLTSGGAASGVASVEINNTTVATSGSPVTLRAETWNEAAGWAYEPPAKARITVAASERLVVRITAPADSITLNGTLIWEEV